MRIGETHLLLHTADLCSASGVPSVVYAPLEPLGEGQTTGEELPHLVRCRRCEAPVGTTVATVGGSPVSSSVRLHKDRVTLPRPGQSTANVFSRYTTATRLFSELTDRASAHSQYRFLVHACDKVTGRPLREGEGATGDGAYLVWECGCMGLVSVVLCAGRVCVCCWGVMMPCVADWSVFWVCACVGFPVACSLRLVRV